MGENLIVIGERINTTRGLIANAVKKKDKDKIKKEAKLQIKNGADYLDINCGVNVEKELDNFLWVLDIVVSNFEADICIDSVNVNVVKEALDACGDREIIINSITAEPERYEKILPLVKKYNVNIVALTMETEGLPKNIERRLKITENLLKIFDNYNIKKEKVFIDPLVRPISTEPEQPSNFISTLIEIKENFGLKVISGISNVSYGLPNRALLNSHFLTVCIHHGLDAAIMDPSQKYIKPAIFSSLAISGRDEYGMDYIKGWREGNL